MPRNHAGLNIMRSIRLLLSVLLLTLPAVAASARGMGGHGSLHGLGSRLKHHQTEQPAAETPPPRADVAAVQSR